MCHAVCEKPKEFEAWRKAQRDERLLEAHVREITYEVIHKNRTKSEER